MNGRTEACAAVCLSVLIAAVSSARVLDVREMGARGDGQANDTAIIQMNLIGPCRARYKQKNSQEYLFHRIPSKYLLYRLLYSLFSLCQEWCNIYLSAVFPVRIRASSQT